MHPDVTQLLAEAHDDPTSAARLFEAVYADLRAIASAQMRSERDDHTLQPTALVSEAYIRLLGGAPIQFNDRKHFFRVASEAMRRILVDHARARLAEKRGGGERPRELFDSDGAFAMDPDRLIALDEAMEKLHDEDPRATELVRLRFYAGLSIDQAAELLEISRRTAMRDWGFARARLSELMTN
jgi:RNA polymerase sigma factor (TIGR02999 family)